MVLSSTQGPKPKKPWRDGTTHLVMSPLEVMQRRAATVTGRRAGDTRASGRRATA